MDTVAITGLGVISSIGTGYEDFEEQLNAGTRSCGALSLFELPNAPDVAEIQFNVEDHIDTVKSYIDRTSALALAACTMAQEEAGWQLSDAEKLKAGLALGTAWGCVDSTELFADKYMNAGPKRVPSLVFTHSYINAPNSIIAIEYGLRGFNICFGGGHASGMQAVAYGADQIRLGRSGHILAGGADALSRFALSGYGEQGLLSSTSQPMDANSSGFLLSEGCCVLALEPTETAGERAYALIAGAGLSRSDEAGIHQAMTQALAEAGIEPGDVSLLVSGASGNPVIDAAEAGAVNRLFGELSGPPAVCCPKALTGESMGASGPIAVASAIALLDAGEVPATLPEDCRFPFNSPTECSGEIALVNSLSLEGDAVSLVVRLP